jgi:hypothetical protein
MRSFTRFRHAALVAVLVLTTLLLAPSTAFAQYLRYEAVGFLKQFNDVIDAGTTADLASAGIVAGGAGVGTPVTSVAIVAAAEADTDADPTIGSYPAFSITLDVGNGTLEASDFQRDQDVSVGLNQTVVGVPFPLDIAGWSGSEPTQTVMPGAFLFDDQAPSAPGAGDGRGFAVGAVAIYPSTVLPNDALPTSLDVADFIAVPLYLDLVDTSRETVPGTPDKIQLEFQITSLTVTHIADPTPVPATGPLGIGLLVLAMAGTGAATVWLRKSRGLRA